MGFRGAGRTCRSRSESHCRRTNFFRPPVSTISFFVTRISFPHASSRLRSNRAITGQFSAPFNCRRSGKADSPIVAHDPLLNRPFATHLVEEFAGIQDVVWIERVL